MAEGERPADETVLLEHHRRSATLQSRDREGAVAHEAALTTGFGMLPAALADAL